VVVEICAGRLQVLERQAPSDVLQDKKES